MAFLYKNTGGVNLALHLFLLLASFQNSHNYFGVDLTPGSRGYKNILPSSFSSYVKKREGGGGGAKEKGMRNEEGRMSRRG